MFRGLKRSKLDNVNIKAMNGSEMLKDIDHVELCNVNAKAMPSSRASTEVPVEAGVPPILSTNIIHFLDGALTFCYANSPKYPRHLASKLA